MESCGEDNRNAFVIFCNQQNILEYFNTFQRLIEKSEYFLDVSNITNLNKCLLYLEQNSVFENSIDHKSSNELYFILTKIFNVLQDKYLKPLLTIQVEESYGIRSFLFDTLTLLLKILLRTNQKIYLQPLLIYLIDYFQNVFEIRGKFDISESDQEQLHHTLKFLVKILKSLNHRNFSEHVTDKNFIQILHSIQFCDKFVVNTFVNQILPYLIKISKPARKKILLHFIWKRITSDFERNSHNSEELNLYTLLCSFSEYVFNDQYDLYSFDIYDNIFWKIIQNGLISCSSYNRKQTIYVFKILLFWLKTKNDIYTVVCDKIPIFSICSSKDLLIWNDLLALFEVLEEKQIHIIKPVLPKFTRILQYASLGQNASNRESPLFHPSWIACFIKRMIIHESKFIIKQGLSLGMNLSFKDCPVHLLNPKLFMEVFIKAFNDQNMYYRMKENESSSLFLSSEKIVAFFTNYISAFDSKEQKIDFLRHLLKLIASQSWCGVALIQLSFSLTKLSSLPSWTSDDILHLRKIIQVSLNAYEPVFRNIIEYWLLKSCILFMDWDSLCFADLLELLSIFKSLHRHTLIWSAMVSKLKEIFSMERCSNLSIHEAKIFSMKCIEKIQSGDKGLEDPSFQKIARLLMILADSSVICPDLHGTSLNWSHILKPLTFILIDAPKRPYIPAGKFYGILQFYTLLITEGLGISKNSSDEHIFAIISCLNCSTELLEFIYDTSQIDFIDNGIFQFQILFNSLTVLSSLDSLHGLFFKLLHSFIEKYERVPGNFLSKKIIIILIYSIVNIQLFDTKRSKNLQSSNLNKCIHFVLSKIIDDNIINDLSKCVLVNELEKNVWLELSTKSVCDFWTVTSHTVAYMNESDLKLIAEPLFCQAEMTFNGGPKAAIPCALNCIKSLIPLLDFDNISVIKDLLNSGWKACSELHGNEFYRPAFISFVQAIFQPHFLQDKYFDILYEYIGCFQKLSENGLGIFYQVVKKFCDVFTLKDLFRIKFNFVPILTHALTYGPIHHKSQKILEDTVAYISDHDESFATDVLDYNKPSIFVRIVATTYLLKNFSEKCPENEEIALMLINGLLKLDNSTSSSKSSKFANSFCHRISNRIWQAILLLQPYVVSSEENKNFLERILDFLEFETHQPSIRYLQEFLILRVINEHKSFIKDFFSILENSLEKRPGFLTSLLSILIHLIIHDLIDSENYAYRCFPVLINYCMAQNFAVRLYSRLALMKLFAFCESHNFIAVVKKYDFLHNLASFQPESAQLEKGNVYKNLQKISEDFYFCAFHPIHHFSLETIFYELPRLSNVTSDEWIKPSTFTHHLSTFSDFSIPCFNMDNLLKNSFPSSWLDKSEEPIVENESFDYNFQKKICPSRFDNSVCDSVIDTQTDSKLRNELIVIASLIDRIPNLGGLCRTCEIFGVNQFVIGSLKYAEDKQFQNLAVSADKWVSIKEVKPYHLKEYLLALKEEGYTLVGAEQTDDSYKLNDYVFPTKSALLLGHEKEGMPVELIQLLDACVEIPQQGIIRSLNVHVSGAIFIWEYARQQIKQIK